MPDTVVISVPVDERTKQNADAALAPLGLTTVEVLRRAVERIARRDQDWQVALIAIEGLDKQIPPDFFRQALERIAREIELRPVLIDFLERPLTPNAETVEALEAARRGDTKAFKTIDELLADLNSDADD